MLNGSLIGIGVGFVIAIYNSLFVVEVPVTVELVANFMLYLVPWAIVGGAIGWFMGSSNPSKDKINIEDR